MKFLLQSSTIIYSIRITLKVGGKAKFFHAHEIHTEDALKSVLLFILQNNEVKEAIQTAFGMKYIVEGNIPYSEKVVLKTVWIVLKGEKICRFVTAYPL